MFDAWIEACRAAGKWKRAIAMCTRLAERFAPDGAYVDELAICVLRMTTDRLTKPPRSFTTRDARYLRVGIRSLERVCDRQGPTTLVMAGLARLNAMHAVALRNTGATAEALVALTMAFDYGGDSARLRSTRDALIAAVQRTGELEPMEQYRSSPRAQRIRAMRSALDAIDLWRSIGLARPDADWPGRAQMLVTAMSRAKASGTLFAL
jgi:hypothetical protein